MDKGDSISDQLSVTTLDAVFQIGQVLTVKDCFMLSEYEATVVDFVLYDNSTRLILSRNGYYSMGSIAFVRKNQNLLIASVRATEWLKSIEDVYTKWRIIKEITKL